MSSPSSAEGPAPVPDVAPESGDGTPPLEASAETAPGIAAEVAPDDALAASPEDSSKAPPEAEEEEDTSNHRFECRSCGFVYDPGEGVRKLGIEVGTPFEALNPLTFRCPVCRSRVGAFRDIGPREKPSGFEENLNFGLGVNRLTPGQKNVLIFGGFALAIAFFLSLYSLR